MPEEASDHAVIDKQQLIREIVRLERDIYYALVENEPSPWLTLTFTREQLRILFLLFLQGELTPGGVASALGVSKANVTGTIDRLVDQEMVSRTQDTEDRRSYLLRLTEAGHAQVAKFSEWAIARMREALDRMQQEDLLILSRGLRALYRTAEHAGTTTSSAEHAPGAKHSAVGSDKEPMT